MWCSICSNDFIIDNILLSIINPYYWNRTYKEKKFHQVEWRSSGELKRISWTPWSLFFPVEICSRSPQLILRPEKFYKILRIHQAPPNSVRTCSTNSKIWTVRNVRCSHNFACLHSSFSVNCWLFALFEQYEPFTMFVVRTIRTERIANTFVRTSVDPEIQSRYEPGHLSVQELDFKPQTPLLFKPGDTFEHCL